MMVAKNSRLHFTVRAFSKNKTRDEMQAINFMMIITIEVQSMINRRHAGLSSDHQYLRIVCHSQIQVQQ